MRRWDQAPPQPIRRCANVSSWRSACEMTNSSQAEPRGTKTQELPHALGKPSAPNRVGSSAVLGIAVKVRWLWYRLDTPQDFQANILFFAGTRVCEDRYEALRFPLTKRK